MPDDLSQSFLDGYFKTLDNRQRSQQMFQQQQQFLMSQAMERERMQQQQSQHQDTVNYQQGLLSNDRARESREVEAQRAQQQIQAAGLVSSGHAQNIGQAEPAAIPGALGAVAAGQVPGAIALGGQRLLPLSPDVQAQRAEEVAKKVAAQQYQQRQNQLGQTLDYIDKNHPDSSFAKGKPARDMLIIHSLTGIKPDQEHADTVDEEYRKGIVRYLDNLDHPDEAVRKKEQRRFDAETRIVIPYRQALGVGALANVGLHREQYNNAKTDAAELLDAVQALQPKQGDNQDYANKLRQAAVIVNNKRALDKKPALHPDVIKSIEQDVGKNNPKDSFNIMDVLKSAEEAKKNKPK